MLRSTLINGVQSILTQGVTRRCAGHTLASRLSLRMASSGEYTYKYPRPAFTVDAAIIAQPDGSRQSQILLIRRKNPPCKGAWALPGGFVDENESLDGAAARELQEETSVNPADVVLEQIGAFGDAGRDPRGWAVTAAYVALVPSTSLGVKAADDAADARWFDVANPPQPLAFDHKILVRRALEILSKREEAQQPGFKEQLQKGIQALQGGWDPPKE